MPLFLLFESSSGYAVLEVLEHEEIGADDVQDSVADVARFTKIVQLRGFRPFLSAENALDNINKVSEGLVSDLLQEFLETTLGSQHEARLGVSDEKLAVSIQEATSVRCEKNAKVMELLRGVRQHFAKFIQVDSEDLDKAQLGLGHSYSRAKVKFNVNRVDNMIIQSIALLDQLDKDLNTFSMRVREWYSWHFPELYKVEKDNLTFARLVHHVGDKATLSENSVEGLAEICGDHGKAQAIVDAAKTSMGMEISQVDLINLRVFAEKVISLGRYKQKLHGYLLKKMDNIAPNLSALIGEIVGARLISHAGSLTNLAKYPASTVQILGAEKALFRALKTKGNTPKYGLIFHSSFIGKASTANKGRISRYLANKCSMASRIDCFREDRTRKFGDKMREQVEERLDFYTTGKTPRKNADVMAQVLADVGRDIVQGEASPSSAPLTTGTGGAEGAPSTPKEAAGASTPSSKKSKKKKKKSSKKSSSKKKRSRHSDAMEDAPAEEAAVTPVAEKKRKKKKHKK